MSQKLTARRMTAATDRQICRPRLPPLTANAAPRLCLRPEHNGENWKKSWRQISSQTCLPACIAAHSPWPQASEAITQSPAASSDLAPSLAYISLDNFGAAEAGLGITGVVFCCAIWPLCCASRVGADMTLGAPERRFIRTAYLPLQPKRNMVSLAQEICIAHCESSLFRCRRPLGAAQAVEYRRCCRTENSPKPKS